MPQSPQELEEAISPLQEALSAVRTQLAKDELLKAIELREREKYSAAIAKLERAQAYEPALSEIQKEIQATKEAERAEGSEKIYTKGKRAFKAQRWGESISILQRYLDLEPDDNRRIRKAESWIEDARLQEDLAERYAAARQAIDRGVTRRAISLLQEIKYLEENYRDVDWLLSEARVRWLRDLFSKFAFGAMGTAIVVFLGWFLLRPGGAMQQTAVQVGFYENTPTATATATLPPATSTPAPILTSTPTPTPTPVPFAWKRLNSIQFLARDTVNTLVIDPNDEDIWYAGTFNAGVYKSVNGGISWLPIQNGLGRTGITNMVIAHDDPMKLYLSTASGNPYKTTDGGLHWENAGSGISPNDWGPSDGDIAIDTQDRDHLFYLNSNGVYETKDGANTWKKIHFDQEISDCGVPTGIRFSPADPNIVILLRGGPVDDCNSIYRSTDGGQTWDSTGIEVIGVFWDDIWIEPNLGNYIYVRSGHQQASYVSKDSGETWDTHFNDCTMMAFIPDDERIAYCVQWGGWFRRTLDGGQNWQDINRLSIQDGQSLAIAATDPSKFIAGGEGVYLSTDSGVSWEERSNGLGASRVTIRVDPLNSSILYLHVAFTSGAKPGPLFRSVDGGRNWDLIDEAGFEMAFDANQGMIYRSWEKDIWGRQAGEKPAIMRSNDHGETWEILATLPDNVTDIQGVHPDPEISRKLYVDVISTEGEFNQCYTSLDGGESWDEGQAWNNSSCDKFNVQKTDFIQYDGNSYYMNEKVSLPNEASGNFADTTEENIINPVYAATDGGAFVSFDGEKTWAPINDGLLDGLVVYSIDMDQAGNVYASTPLGVFRLE